MPNNELESLAFDYFKLFAQLEAVMKARDMVRPKGRPNAQGHLGFEACWKSLAENLGDQFLDKIPPGALRFIFKHPPKKQVLLNDQVQWVPSRLPDIDVHSLLLYLARLRNNLFHGAKFDTRFEDTWVMPARSEVLLRHGLAILHSIRRELT